MTEPDLARIERALGIQLPPDYRELVLHHPIREDHGKSCGMLWDEPDAIIEWNRKYREGFAGLKEWPKYFYLVGDDGAASPYVLDLRTTPSKVYQLDHGNTDAVLVEGETITKWMADFVQYMRDQGEDPDAEPPPPGTATQNLFMCCAVFGTVALIGFLIGWLSWKWIQNAG